MFHNVISELKMQCQKIGFVIEYLGQRENSRNKVK